MMFLLLLANIICFAQVKTCNLRLHVFEYIEDNKTEYASLLRMNQTNVITDAKAVAVNTLAKETFNSNLSSSKPYFYKVKEGKYEVTVSKNGYRKTMDLISLDCSITDRDNKYCESILLHRGDEKEVIKANPTFYAGERPRGGACNLTLPSPKLPPLMQNGDALSLPKPAYPAAARALRIFGDVSVYVLIDETSIVVEAKAFRGHELLRKAAEKVALEAKFTPTLIEKTPVKTIGIITYDFVP